MPAPEPHFDLTQLDPARLLYDRAGIRDLLPHRYEMELLDGVMHLDPVAHIIVGYKDVRPDEFWVRGHFPGGAILPGVLMCESAAQLTGVYMHVRKLCDSMLGLGGIENTRFRRTVVPGERLVLVGKGVRVRPRMNQFSVQGYVNGELAFHTEVIGVSLSRKGDQASDA